MVRYRSLLRANPSGNYGHVGATPNFQFLNIRFPAKPLSLLLNACVMLKRSPLSLSDFKQVIERDAYYVDKTAFIRAVVDGAGVQLHCRPRRFGKTLNLSTLRYFFDRQGEYRHLFEGLAVTQDEEMMQHQGKYPIITLSFKDVKASSYTSALGGMAKLLYREWLRHPQLTGNPMYDEMIADMNANIRSGDIRPALFEDAILELTKLLHAHHGAKVVLLIDEYDSPLIAAWLRGYYEEMAEFMRTLLGGALKDNDDVLFKGVLTGILRVAKESLFSGLNNFISDAGLKAGRYADKFGFTEPEVQVLLAHYGQNGREMEEIAAWYDGYRYGGIPIYNPWSILNYVDEGGQSPSPYWVNTGGHDLLKRLFFGKETDVKEQLSVFMRGESLYAYVDEFLTFRGLETNPNAILSLMYFAGYLRVVGETRSGDRVLRDLSIPNREVKLAYEDTLMAWFNEDLSRSFNDALLEALLSGQVMAFGARLADFVVNVASFYDTSKDRTEHFYHAFLLGLLARLAAEYPIRSNRESGFGRYDICLIPKDVSKKGVVMEIKAPALGSKEALEDCIAAARAQILDNQYDTELLAHGVTDILRLAIAVDGKKVIVEEV